MHGNNIATGTVEGTGSAINVECGFQPRAVKVINIDGDAILDWTEDMGADAGYKTVAAGTNALVSSGGITKYAGSAAANSEGFTIGTDADVNASAETLVYIAYR